MQKGTTILETKSLTFTNGSCKVNCAIPQQVITTLGGVTKESDYSYDQYNNQIDEKDYDWGSGSHGGLLRDTQTSYSTSYTAQNILNLPAQRAVYDGSGAMAAQSLFSYDANGNLTQQQQLIASGQYATTKYTYDSNGDIASVTDPDSHTTTLAYSPSSVPPVSVTNAKNQTTSIGYNGLDQPVSLTDANGAVTTFAYNDPMNRLTEIQYPNDGNSYFNYPSPTELITQRDQNKPGDAALKSKTLYDGFGRPIENDTFENASQYIATTTQYDPLGHVAVKTNPSRPGDGLNYPTTYSYDALGRLTQVKTADGATVTTSYSGNQKTVTDPAGHSKTMTYDALGLLTSVADATGTTDYTYNALGKLTKVAQGSQTRTFSYDMLGRLTQATNPESGTVSYAYDAAGNLTSRTDARGVKTTYTYDALNRLVYKSYSDSTPAVTYVYDVGTDGKGHLTGYLNADSVSNFTFDTSRHVATSSQITGGQEYDFTYAYNLAGALISETYPSGRVMTTGYDGANRPITVTGKLNGQSTNYVATAAYYPHGAPYYYQYGNGVIPTWSYNSRLQMSALWADLDYDPNRYLFYSALNWGTTNDNGNLLGETLYEGGPGALSTLTKFGRGFGYDGANRLTSATDSGGWSRTFGYDQYGNMWVTGASGVPLAGNTPTTNVYNPSNNQISGGSYDAAGNQLVVNGDTLTYGAENHVASAYDSVTHNTEYYLYDGAGQRMMKTGPAGETVYVYDAFGQLAAEYSTAPQNSPCKLCYLSYDQRGDVRMVTDASGNVVARHDYLPFGTEVPANTAGRNSQWGLTTDVEQKFTGQIRDTETGMDYFHARYYGSAFGRFTSPDPGNAGANPMDPQSWNAYAYVMNNPATHFDPLGLDALSPSDYQDLQINVTQGAAPFVFTAPTNVYAYVLPPMEYASPTPVYISSSTGGGGTGGGGMSQSTAAAVVAAASAPAKNQPSKQQPTKTATSTSSAEHPTTTTQPERTAQESDAQYIATLAQVTFKLGHPLDMLAVNASMFFTAGVQYTAAVAVVVGGCAEPTPAEPATCIGGLALGAGLAANGTAAAAFGGYFFEKYTFPAIKSWGN